jgi:hypothetical protein
MIVLPLPQIVWGVNDQMLIEYQCKWGKQPSRPIAISQPYTTLILSNRDRWRCLTQWIRYPMDLAARSSQRSEKKQSIAQQLRLDLWPELLKTA